MKRPTLKIIIILFITAFILSLFTCSSLAQLRELKTEEKVERAKETASASVIQRPKVEYNAQNLRDPFQVTVAQEAAAEKPAAGAKKVSLGKLNVQGVIWGGKFPQAIINGQVVKVGDTVDGARIVSIDKDGITVFVEGRQVTIPSPAAESPVP